EDAIRLVGALQGKELLSGRTVDCYGVDLSTADGVKSLFRFRQPGAQLRQVVSIPANWAALLHLLSGFGFKSSNTRTRPRSDKSPIRRRMGSGSCFTRVGAAMTLAALAKVGEWYTSTISTSQLPCRYSWQI